MPTQITLNSVNFYPTDVSAESTKIGVALVMASGARRFVHRLSGATPIYKGSWTLTWKRVPVAVVVAVSGIHALTTTFAFVDQHGTTWTVQTEEDAYAENVSLIAAGNVLYYDLSLKLFQI